MTRIDAGDVIIVGAGLAGLYTALKLAPRKVTVLVARKPGSGASSAWAQGGVAAALGDNDGPALHAADTIAAGAGIVDPAIAGLIAAEAPARIHDLAALGVPFDRDASGNFVLGREAAHGRNRIVRINGDRAGAGIMQALIAAAKKTPSIQVVWDVRAQALAFADGRVAGVFAARSDTPLGLTPTLYTAPYTVLAAGGIGALYAVTTNPPEAQGDGLAMAARAGAVIADPEFVQFHPTALDIGRDPAPLATEALRGEGAILLNAQGERFMAAIHPLAELAPRDVVARAIHRERRRTGRVFLDCRKAVGPHFPTAFPTVYGSCRAAGIDPIAELIPVAPAAHFHMGGIAVDACGRSSLDGLFACGEVASTGAHGANRLASNSLLEAVVFGARIAAAIKDDDTPRSGPVDPLSSRPSMGKRSGDRLVLRRLMSDSLGLERDARGLAQALRTLSQLDDRSTAPNGSLAVAGTLIAAAALMRRESRGGHYRRDYPDTDESLARRTFLTLADAEVLAAGLPPEAANDAAPEIVAAL